MEWRAHTPPGSPPSTLVSPEGSHVPETVHVFQYTADSVEETDLADVKELAAYRKKEGITWVNVPGLGNVEMIRELGKLLDFHPLALEDVLQIPQRPKVDDYASHIFVVIRMLHFEQTVETEQVSIFLGSDFVVTFQEHPGDCLDPVRERLRKGTGQLRQQGADYLMYAILDTVIDNYFPFLERVGEVVEELENEVVARPTRETLRRVHDIKRDLLDVRRAVWPLRDAVNALIRNENPLLRETTQVYLRDCYDHTIQVLDVVVTYRELAGGLMDVYLSSISNKMNEVMKVLTIIATIFIPLTFIAGLYGMNFERMPELRWAWAYPAVLLVMVMLAGVMLLYFRHKGWLGGGKKG